MRIAGVTRTRRIAAGLMGLALLLALALGALFLIVEADHDCAGEDCPICALMQTCVLVLRRCGEMALVLLTAAVPGILLLFAAAAGAAAFAQETPVSRRIRLNN